MGYCSLGISESIDVFPYQLTPALIQVSEIEFNMALSYAAEIPCTDSKCHNARADYQSTRRCARCVLLDHLHAMKRHL